MDHRFAYKTSTDKFVDDDYEYSVKAKSHKEKVYDHSENSEGKHSHKADTYKGKNYSHSEPKHSDKVYKHSEKGFIFDDNLIEEVVNTYSDMVYRIALNILCNIDDANDVMQDVFLRLVKSKSKIKSKEHIKHWLIKVTINCSRSKATESYKKNTVSISEISESYISFSKKLMKQ